MLGPGRQERSWIRGAQGGSASDLEALFKEHWPRAHRAAYLVVQDGAAAEDIAQEAFLSAIRNLDRFDRRRPFGPWLHRIVVNRAIDWARARSLRREISEAPGSEDFDTGDLGRFSDGVAAGLASLGPEQRAVIVLRYLLEYTPGGDRRAARPSSRDGQLPPAPRARPARDDPRQGAAVSEDLRRALQRIQGPDELEAERRAWAMVRSSFDAREPLAWQQRNRRPLLLAAAVLVVLLLALLSSPGRALVGNVHDAVTSDEPHSAEASPDRAPRTRPAARQLEHRPVDRPVRRLDAEARPVVGRLLVAERGARGGDASPSARRADARRDDQMVARTEPDPARRALVARGSRPVLPDRVSQRPRAARRRGRRDRGRAAAERGRADAARVEAGIDPPARVLDRGRADRAGRRGLDEDDLAHGSGRCADAARLVGGRRAAARARRAVAARLRRERAQAVVDRASGRAVRASSSPARATASC